MRRPHREIEIFSMSVLDMFASALGAFIMVAIILFPYFKPDIKQQLTESIETLARKKNELQTTNESATLEESRHLEQQRQVEEIEGERERTRRCRADLAVCVGELSKTFLMVMMQWNEPVDANLHVTNQNGEEFFWNKNNMQRQHFPNSEAQMSFDVAVGPGIEVWLDPLVTPGDYKVEYRLLRPYGRDVPVTGYFIDRTGRRPLPSKTLNDRTPRALAATLRLAPDGRITIQPQ